jgi:hypothetical protein
MEGQVGETVPKTSVPDGHTAPRSQRTLARILLPLAGLVGLAAWASGVWNRAFDYDEVMQAHAIWQIGQGLVPFHDFFECHTPLLWYLFVPAVPLLPEGPELLFGLRVLSGLGLGLWLTLLLWNTRIARPQFSQQWLVLAACLLLFQRQVLDYAVQFRPDTWAWAAAMAALLHFQLRPASRFRRFVWLGAAGTFAVLALPKLALLFPSFAAIDLLRRGRAGEPLLPNLGGYALGISAGLAVTLGLLFAAGIDPLTAWDLSVRYHSYVVAEAGFTRGVFEEVLAAPLPLAISLLGLGAWAGWLVRARLAPTTFELAVLLTVTAQLVLVRIPHVQYVAPVFISCAVFLPYCGLWVREFGSRWSPAPVTATGTAAALAICAASLALTTSWGSGAAARFADVQRAVLELAPPEARIVVPPPFHPMVRHDALYGLIQTWLPSGLTTEQAMRQLELPYADRRGAAYYRQELEEHRPAVILFTGRREFYYSPEQAEAISSYLSQHSAEYRSVVGLRPTLWVRGDLLASRLRQEPLDR